MNIGVIEGLIRNSKYSVSSFECSKDRRRIYLNDSYRGLDENDEVPEYDRYTRRGYLVPKTKDVNRIDITLKKDDEIVNFNEKYEDFEHFVKDLIALGEVLQRAYNE